MECLHKYFSTNIARCTSKVLPVFVLITLCHILLELHVTMSVCEWQADVCMCVCVCTLTLCAESECRSDMEQASGERADERACNTHNMLVPARTRGEARMRDQDGERATRFVLVLLMSKAEVKLDAKYYSLPTVSSIFINNLCGARCLRTIA